MSFFPCVPGLPFRHQLSRHQISLARNKDAISALAVLEERGRSHFFLERDFLCVPAMSSVHRAQRRRMAENAVQVSSSSFTCRRRVLDLYSVPGVGCRVQEQWRSALGEHRFMRHVYAPTYASAEMYLRVRIHAGRGGRTWLGSTENSSAIAGLPQTDRHQVSLHQAVYTPKRAHHDTLQHAVGTHLTRQAMAWWARVGIEAMRASNGYVWHRQGCSARV